MSKQALLFFVLGFLLMVLVWENPTPEQPLARAPDSLFAQIQKEKVVRAAYFVGAPLFMMDPVTHAKSGLFHDILESAAQKLGWRVDWVEETGYGAMSEGLKTGRYDVVGSGVWINAARGAEADFTQPAFFDAVAAYVRAGDTRFDRGLSVLNDPAMTIAVMDGEMGARIAQQDFPKAQMLALPQQADFTQLILNVIARKADVVFLAAGPAQAYQAKNPGLLVAVKGKPVRAFGNALMLPQGEPTLRRALDLALDEMRLDGEMETLIAHYEPVPGSFLRARMAYEPR